MELAVLDTRQVLLDHLTAKIAYYCSSKDVAGSVVSEIVERGLTNQDILDLLQSDNALRVTLHKSKVYSDDREELGGQLFLEVSLCETELCAQITGMLLELDTATIKLLLDNQDLLQEAVEKAKNEFIAYINLKKEKEELGEEIYERVCEYHDASTAGRLTGMLLELDTVWLRRLLKDPDAMRNKIEVAFEALTNYQSEESS